MIQIEEINLPGMLPMKALIFCDDFAFATTASETLLRVGHPSNAAVKWEIENCSIVALQRADMAEQSLKAGLAAHLIILPSLLAHSLSLHLLDWLEQWAALRQIEDAAVAVMSGDADAGFTESISSELTFLARNHGLKLINGRAPIVNNTTTLVARFGPECELRLPVVTMPRSQAMTPVYAERKSQTKQWRIHT